MNKKRRTSSTNTAFMLHREVLETRYVFSAGGYPFTDDVNATAESVRVADIDGDGKVGFSDVLILSANFNRQNSSLSHGDLDGDAAVRLSDFLILASKFGSRLPIIGDANLDAEVDFADFLILTDNFQRTDAVWTDGDFNADSLVDFEDLQLLAQHFGETCSDADMNGPAPADPTQNLSIFSEGRVYEYDATYAGSDGRLLSQSSVTIMATGNPWPSQPRRQVEIIVKYEFTQQQEAEFSSNPINPEFQPAWRALKTTGVVESGDRIWMHPIRRNQFISTEVAPFPDVRLPIEPGKTWSSELPIPVGTWGIWGGTNVHSTYTVDSAERRQYAFADETLDVWKVVATSEFEFGTSSVTFYFHEVFGFVEMLYVNYAGESIDFVMVGAT